MLKGVREFLLRRPTGPGSALGRSGYERVGLTILSQDGSLYVDPCSCADVAELLQLGDLLWQALGQPRELRCTKARIELKRAVLQGLALDLVLQDWASAVHSRATARCRP